MKKIFISVIIMLACRILGEVDTCMVFADLFSGLSCKKLTVLGLIKAKLRKILCVV